MQLLSKETPALTQVVYPPSRGERDGVLGRQPFPQPFLLTCYRLPSVGAICIRPVVGKSPPLSYREHPSAGKYEQGPGRKHNKVSTPWANHVPGADQNLPEGFHSRLGEGGGIKSTHWVQCACSVMGAAKSQNSPLKN